jgi:hypothetical protein
MSRWVVILVSTNIGPHASAFAIVRAESRTEAAARAVRCADAWGATQRKRNIGVDGGDATTSRDGQEEIGAFDGKLPRPSETSIGSREFRAVLAVEVSFFEEVARDMGLAAEQLPARFALWNLGKVHEDA